MTAGSFTFTRPVRDETGATDTETFTIEILPPEAPTITTEALSSRTVGEFYCCGTLFASGGVQPYTWSVVAGAPTSRPGAAEAGHNTISGTLTTAGTFTFTVRVTDDLGAFSEKEFSQWPPAPGVLGIGTGGRAKAVPPAPGVGREGRPDLGWRRSRRPRLAA